MQIVRQVVARVALAAGSRCRRRAQAQVPAFAGNVMVRATSSRSSRAAAVPTKRRKSTGPTAIAATHGAPVAAAVAAATKPAAASGAAHDFEAQVSQFTFPRKHKDCVRQRDPTGFERRVYVACSSIPAGKVSTYGNVAAFLGSSPRAVGNALRKNPFHPVVPCHRVVASTLELGGFHGTWGAASPEVKRKKSMLTDEGVVFDETKSKNKGGRITQGCFFDLSAHPLKPTRNVKQ